MTTGSLLAIITGILGLSGLIFTALKYNRDDTSALVGQQSQILSDMKALNDELHKAMDEVRAERDGLRKQVDELRQKIEDLTVELRVANAKLSGQMGRIQDSLDG